MTKRRLFLILTLPIIGFLAGCATFPFGGMHRLRKQAKENEYAMLNASSYSDALSENSAAISNLEHIVSTYPDSKTASLIKSGSFPNPGLSLHDLKKVKTALQPLAKIEHDPTSCALLVAGLEDKKTEQFDVLVNISTNYAEAGMLDSASNILSRAGELIETVQSNADRADLLMRLAEVYMKSGKNAACSNRLEQAAQLAMATTNSASAINSLVRIAEDYNKLEHPKKADALIARALQSAVQLQPATDDERGTLQYALTKVSIWYFKHGDRAKADCALSSIQKLMASFEDPRDRDDEAGFIADDLAEAGYSAGAMELLDMIQNKSYLMMDLRDMASDCTNEDVLVHIRDKARSIKSHFYRDDVLSTVAQQFIEHGHFIHAIETAANITNHFSNGDAWQAIAKKYAQLGDYPRAICMTSYIHNGTKRAVAQTEVSILLKHQGKYNESEAALAMALASTDHAMFGINKNTALCHVAEILAKDGQSTRSLDLLEQALQWTDAVNDAYLKASGLTEIARQYIKMGKMNLAKKLLVRTSELSDKIDRETYRASVVADLASGYIEAGMFAQAFDLIKTVKPDKDDKCNFLTAAAKHCTEADHFNLVFEAAKTVENKHDQDDIMEKLVKSCLKKGMVDEALQSAMMINYHYDKDDEIAMVSSAYADKEEFAKAIEIACRVDTGYQRAEKLTSIASKCADANRFSLCIDAIGKIKRPYHQSIALADIAISMHDNPEQAKFFDLTSIVQARLPIEKFWKKQGLTPQRAN